MSIMESRKILGEADTSWLSKEGREFVNNLKPELTYDDVEELMKYGRLIKVLKFDGKRIELETVKNSQMWKLAKD